MTFATITPTRNDRVELLSFCKHQLSRMNIKPAKSYFIDYPPKDGNFDLVHRVKEGIKQAKADGIDLVFIIENDDFYPANYFDNIPDADFIGCQQTTYYSLRNNTWQTMDHQSRSSLFTTGVKISALEGFRWPKDTERFLDISIWNFAQRRQRSVFVGEKALGIKHGQGLCGGAGHKMSMKNSDPKREWLKSNVDQEAFIFYQSILCLD